MLEYGQIKIVAQRLRNISHIQRSYEITKNEENEVILGSNKITFYTLDILNAFWESLPDSILKVTQNDY